MISRVTSTMTAANSLSNMQTSARKLADLQDKAASREAIRRPSDDPAGTNTAINARAELSRTTQYERNLKDADTWMLTIDSALSSAADIMIRAQDLTLQASNGATSQAGRDAIAMELEEMSKQMLSLANTQVMGRNVFAGTHAGDSAYSNTTPPTWNGTGTSTVERRISDGSTIRVDVSGPDAFGNGANSVFANLSDLATAVRNGDDLSSRIVTLEANRDSIVDARTVSGVRHSSVTSRLESVQQRLTELEATRMSVEEEDLAKASVEFQTQQVYYQAALAVTSQALSTSLMDFLR